MSDLDFSLVPPGKLQDALDGPALQPPEGVVPNFKNPWNENAASLFGLVLCLIASTTFLLVRIYVRFIKLKLKHLGDCKSSVQARVAQPNLITWDGRKY